MTTSSPILGRPSLLTTKTINRIAKAVQAGKTREETAASAGVSLATLQRWISLGRRARAAGVVATDSRGLEQMALRLVVALEVADRKRRAIEAILSDEAIGKTVPADRKPLGRPTLLTTALVEEIAPLCAGGRISDAADVAGVDRRSVQRWLIRGQEVHAAGGARTQFERLCGTLYARVETARPMEPLPELVVADMPVGQPGTALVATEDHVRQLVAAVRDGATRVQAAARAGISYRTFARWLALGARVNEAGQYGSEHERLCAELRTGVEQADNAKSLRELAPVVEPEGAAPGPDREPVIVISRTPRRTLVGRLIASFLGLRPAYRV
ncbi:hypothetical protein ABZ352_18900 [Streptomyces griseofuscus]|uniref:hypothetical protein n=1 Tax=Streptomyces griseofuscus TaxID=146922 RepID=UPI0033D0A1AB